MRAVRSVAVALDRPFPVVGEDRELVAELKAGSEEAFHYLLRIYQNPTFNLICHIVGNPTDATDVLQDVFLKIFKGIRYFHGESSLKTWIYKIAVHEASNYRRGWLRRLRREPVSLDGDSGAQLAPISQAQFTSETPYQLMEQAERQAMVRRALASLAEPFRTSVVLREIEGLSYEEMAVVLGVPVGTIKSRLLRGREMLRRKLNGGDQRASTIENQSGPSPVSTDKAEILTY